MSANKPERVAPPPPKPVKPGQVKVVRAMFKYDAQQSDELSFDEGDLLYILDFSDSGWWKAKCGDVCGLIPSNYVQENTESIDNPLHEAAKRGNVAFLIECICNKVSVNGLDKAGCTPLHWAAHGGHLDCLKRLLDVGNCQLDVQNKLGDTALHSSAWKGHAGAVQMLLEKGSRTDLKNNEGKTPLNLANDPQTAAFLQHYAQSQNYQYDEEYGNEEDSD